MVALEVEIMALEDQVMLMRKMSLYLLTAVLKRMFMAMSLHGLLSFMLLGAVIVKVWLQNTHS